MAIVKIVDEKRSFYSELCNRLADTETIQRSIIDVTLLPHKNNDVKKGCKVGLVKLEFERDAKDRALAKIVEALNKLEAEGESKAGGAGKKTGKGSSKGSKSK